MLYTEFKVKDKELKLRLTTRDCVSLEKKLGRNPLDDIMAVEKGKLPTITYIVAVLHASLQKYQNGYTEEKVYDLFDDYINEGGSLIDLMEVITEIFKVSGFFKEPEIAQKQAPEQIQEP